MSIYLSKSSGQEEVFKTIGFELVQSAQSQEELTAAIKEAIEEKEEFKALPSFRRYGILQFLEGVARGQDKFKVVAAPKTTAAKKTEDIPRSIKKLQPGASWRKHINGGGWVSSTAYVEATAHVGAKAVVYQNARVTERARVYGAAIVRGDAECYGACHVHGLAVVEGHARVFDAARVLGKVRVGGNVTVGGNTLVRGDVVLAGAQELIDERVAPAVVKETPSSQLLVRGV